MTIKPLTSDIILRHIDEDNKKFFRNNIASVSFSVELYRFGGPSGILPDVVSSISRRASSFTELLVYLPEALSEFFNFNKLYDPTEFYSIVEFFITPIVGNSILLRHDPLNFYNTIVYLRSLIEQEEILKHFNDEESKTLNGVAKE